MTKEMLKHILQVYGKDGDNDGDKVLSLDSVIKTEEKEPLVQLCYFKEEDIIMGLFLNEDMEGNLKPLDDFDYLFDKYKYGLINTHDNLEFVK